MDLWIRSQDRTRLVKIDRLDVTSNRIEANFEKHYGGYDYLILGIYRNKDRALEVLDDIERHLSGEVILERLNKIGGNMDNVFPQIVYIMPKE